MIDTKSGWAQEDLRATAALMVAAIRHRGPDDLGCWVAPEIGLALAHCRLSILDLSSAGHQPMVSASGRYVVTYNGEIYNSPELRVELERVSDVRFRGHSDTEVLLAAIETWGVERTLGRLNGMFAFALWDSVERALFLARDRAGEKPLYYGWRDGRFFLASQLGALRAHPAFPAEIDRQAVAALARLGYVPGPQSIYCGIRKLPPGTFLRVPLDPALMGQPVAYWSLEQVARAGIAAPVRRPEQEIVSELEAVLKSAVKHRMLSDVPLGAFLSGGIDSSTVVALMQAQSASPIKTFTIGMEQSALDESASARQVAEHLGTDHTELRLSPEAVLATVPEIPRIFDEPFADSSQVPTFLVAQLARKQVTVGLSGDGGDELFGGYTRHRLCRSVWNAVRWWPAPLRRGLGTALRTVPPATWEAWFSALKGVMPQISAPGDKLHKLASILDSPDRRSMYVRVCSYWDAEAVVLGAAPGDSEAVWPASLDFPSQMMLADALSYLPDDILVKVDRATMAVSLEGRMPFLDPRVIEFAWGLPVSFKLRAGVGKWAVRQVLYKYVPRPLVDRPKCGFGMPVREWLRTGLRDWAEDLLDAAGLRRSGYFDPALVRSRWAEHLSGTRNRDLQLWAVLMFESWLRHARRRQTPRPDFRAVSEVPGGFRVAHA